MKLKTKFLRNGFLAILFLQFIISPVFAETKQSDSISIRIVPNSRVREDGKQTLELYQPTQHFYVVVTNVSNHSVRLWREWCSWGYDSLSFEVTNEKGELVLVKKVPGEWAKNYPDWTSLQPGDHMVFEVSFDPNVWTNAPLPEVNKSREFKMRAVFEIQKDNDSNVWYGKVFSPEQTYTIYR